VKAKRLAVVEAVAAAAAAAMENININAIVTIITPQLRAQIKAINIC
jgi:hypothetical protein